MKLKRTLALGLALVSLTAFSACDVALSEDYQYVYDKLNMSVGAIKDIVDIVTGNPSEQQPNSGTPNNQPSDNETSNNTPNNIGFVTETDYVTAIENALTATNSTAREEITYSYNDTPISFPTISNYANADNLAHYYGSQEGEDYDYYFSTIDDVNYRYDQIGDEWVRSVYENAIDYSNARFYEILTGFKAYYAQLTYNADHTTFETDELELTDPTTLETQKLSYVTVKFVESKFVSLSFVVLLYSQTNEQIGTYTYYLSIVEQGTTSVTLPTVNQNA